MRASTPHNSSPYYPFPTIHLHYISSPLPFVSTAIRLHTIHLLTIRLPQFVSTTIRIHCYSSPLQLFSTTIRLPQFVSTTFRLHCYSSPLLFVSTTIHLLTIRLRQFASISICLHFPLLLVSIEYFVFILCSNSVKFRK